ncbi:MAG: hypothetical protein WEA99_07045 [Brumimicrobium sp.]
MKLNLLFPLTILLVIDFALGQKVSKTLESNFMFEENLGQVMDQFYNSRSDILFTAKSHASFTCFFKENGISYQIVKKSEEDTNRFSTSDYHRVDFRWIDANDSLKVIKNESSNSYNINMAVKYSNV